MGGCHEILNVTNYEVFNYYWLNLRSYSQHLSLKQNIFDKENKT